MRISSMTDIGKSRRCNEDSVRSGSFSPHAAWAVVCDGMGGAVGGLTASTTAADMIASKICACYREGMSSSSMQNMLLSAITTANVAVYDRSRADSELHGMGTTVVSAVIESGSCCVAHAGDSRAYIMGPQGIRQVTKDHSVVQQMYDNGELSEEQMKNHPIKNVITRALGVEEDIDIDFNVETLCEGEILLLCSDGLSNFVDDSDILKAYEEEPFEKLASKLVEMANDNGGGDNISVVAVAWE